MKGTYKVICVGIANDCGEFDDLIGKKGVLKIHGDTGGDADFKDVTMCEINAKIADNLITIKTGYGNVFKFKKQD